MVKHIILWTLNVPFSSKSHQKTEIWTKINQISSKSHKNFEIWTKFDFL